MRKLLFCVLLTVLPSAASAQLEIKVCQPGGARQGVGYEAIANAERRLCAIWKRLEPAADGLEREARRSQHPPWELDGRYFPQGIYLRLSREANAYAYPDQEKVVIPIGTVEWMQHDGELAAIVAHEIAHVSLVRHLENLYPPDTSATERSQFNEIAADLGGAGILVAAGYDPYDFGAALGRLLMITGGEPLNRETRWRWQYLTSHPLTGERITALSTVVKKLCEQGASCSGQALRQNEPIGPEREVYRTQAPPTIPESVPPSIPEPAPSPAPEALDLNPMELTTEQCAAFAYALSGTTRDWEASRHRAVLRQMASDGGCEVGNTGTKPTLPNPQ